MTRPSSQKLVDALEQELLFTGDHRLKLMIAKAKADYYHDFFGVPALPELELYRTFIKLGHHSLAKRVRDGEFDASVEESDEWARSPEGQRTFKSLFKRK